MAVKAMGGKSTKSDQEMFENMNHNNADVCHQRQAMAQARRMDCSMFQDINSQPENHHMDGFFKMEEGHMGCLPKTSAWAGLRQAMQVASLACQQSLS